MMGDGMTDMRWMMGGMRLVWLLIVVFLIAGIIFFVKRSR